MKRVRLSVVVTMVLMGVIQVQAAAQSSVIRSAATELLEIGAKKGARETAEAGAARLSRQSLEETLQRLAREGGEQAVEQFVRSARAHGPDVILAVKNLEAAPGVSLRSVLSLIDEVPSSAYRLSAGASGRELAERAVMHGAGVLRAEVVQPGLGGRLVMRLGGAGEDLVRVAEPADLRVLLRSSSDDLAAIPIRDDFGQFVVRERVAFFPWLAKFAEKNPGKVLLTGASVPIIIAHPEILMGDGEIVFDANGEPVYVAKRGGLFGLADSVTQGAMRTVRTPVQLIGVVIAIGVAVWIGLKLMPAAMVARKRWAVIQRDDSSANKTTGDGRPSGPERNS